MAIGPAYDPPKQEAAPEAIDPNLIDQAVSRIRRQVDGNGMKPGAVKLGDVAGQVYEIFGTTSLLLRPSVAESRRAGRLTDGHIIGNPGLIEAAVQDFIAKTATDQGVLMTVQNMVLSRPDQGFGLVDDVIDLPQISRVFLCHEACGGCRGTGGKTCINCHGQERITCYRCHGQGGVSCVACSGRGQSLTPQGPMTCHACSGRGMTDCPTCYGRRMITCPECQGQGKKPCDQCQGQGWHTRIWTVRLSAQTRFALRMRGLPPGLSGLIDRVGPARLASEGHAHITALMGRAADPFLSQADIAPDAALWYLYRARIPYAQITVHLGRTPITPALAGYKARLIDVPSFMDALLRPASDTLAKGALGGPHAITHILEAARYRLVGDALRGLMRASEKKISKSLNDQYPLGLSPAFLKTLLSHGNQALSKLSLLPRLVALGAALILSGIALYIYHVVGGSPYITNTLGLPLTAYGLWAVDGVVAGLLGVAGHKAIQLAAGSAMTRVIEGLGLVKSGRGPLPKAGWPGLGLWAGLMLITVVFWVFK